MFCPSFQVLAHIPLFGQSAPIIDQHITAGLMDVLLLITALSRVLGAGALELAGGKRAF